MLAATVPVEAFPNANGRYSPQTRPCRLRRRFERSSVKKKGPGPCPQLHASKSVAARELELEPQCLSDLGDGGGRNVVVRLDPSNSRT